MRTLRTLARGLLLASLALGCSDATAPEQGSDGTLPDSPTPQLSVRIYGPTSIRPQDLCTWVVGAQGDTQALSFKWYRSDDAQRPWAFVDTGSEYRGAMNGYPAFLLKVDATDSEGHSASDLITVRGDGTAVCREID